MLKYKVFDLKTFTDNRGDLMPIELSNLCGFSAERTYVVFNTKEARGGHAHIMEQEFFVVVKGACTFLLDDGNTKNEVRLEANKNGLYVPNLLWHQCYDFEDDTILIAYSSTSYRSDRSDYIEDYKKFTTIIKSLKTENV